MRRAGGYPASYNNGGGGYEMVEEENDRMMNTLSSRVNQLKSLSIDIGNEVKQQNALLNDMDNEFDGVGSFLSNTMSRLTALTKKGHHKLMCYVMLFCFFVIIITWFIVRFR